ncbi:Uncharacterized protein FWK35_00033214 [Aphis craccivora]|uniref:Uncharacterized protein n=1 Tax=Aphis craccivora TaxID=307492 RepID=A0A6G0VPP5_APHCR|nr:Uncharacterized protein FWK35_00033214 [Aphis craccivora]
MVLGCGAEDFFFVTESTNTVFSGAVFYGNGRGNVSETRALCVPDVVTTTVHTCAIELHLPDCGSFLTHRALQIRGRQFLHAQISDVSRHQKNVSANLDRQKRPRPSTGAVEGKPKRRTTACLKRLADDTRSLFPEASSAVATDFNMNDYLGVSNDKRLLTGIPNDDNDPLRVLNLDGSAVKMLGLSWSPIIDTYTYKIDKMNNYGVITKRTVLSPIATIFDPMS